MPLETAQILGQLKAPQIDNPLDVQAKQMNLSALRNQAQVQQMQMDAAREEQAGQRTLAELYRGATKPDGTIDRQALLTGTAKAGLPRQYQALQKSFTEQDKDAEAAQKDRLGNIKTKLDISNSAISSLLAKPNVTHQDVAQSVARLVQLGVVDQAQGLQMVQQSGEFTNPADLRNWLISKGMEGMDAAKRVELALPKFDKIDAGNRVVTGTTNQLTGEFTPSAAPIVKAPEGFIVGPDGKLSVDPGFLSAKSQIAAAGRPVTTVSVNTGQKGFENESKLRNDFKSEPIYKDYNDMKSAYAQIKASIAQGTPIGDTAAATKIMKLLDPGSVVRESELGMAMAASGAMDRLTNYVQMKVTGEKLTPQQRKDFQGLADQLFGAATQAYNSKRKEYADFGKGYDLNADRALGGEAPNPTAAAAPGGAPGLPSADAVAAELAKRGQKSAAPPNPGAFAADVARRKAQGVK